MNKKIVISILFILAVSFFLTIYLADNKNTENPPGEVIVLRFEFTNVFLVPLSNGYLLIDNAYSREYDKFGACLEEYDIELSEIKYILLTHHHDDHVGFLNQITSENPDLRVILHKNTADLLKTGYNNKSNGGGIVNKRVYALFKLKQLISPEWDLSFPPYYVRSGDILFEGDFFDLREILGINLKAILTLGHSSDSVTYIYKNRYAFCGDLASNFLNWAGAKYLTVFNEDIALVYSSWKILINNGVEVILTAHGKPFHIDNLKRNINKLKQENVVEFF